MRNDPVETGPFSSWFGFESRYSDAFGEHPHRRAQPKPLLFLLVPERSEGH